MAGEWEGASKTRKTPRVGLPFCSSEVRPATSSSFLGPAFSTHLRLAMATLPSPSPQKQVGFSASWKRCRENPRGKRRGREEPSRPVWGATAAPPPLSQAPLLLPPPLQPGSVPLLCQHLKLASKLSPGGAPHWVPNRAEYPAWRGGRGRENNSELGVFVGQKYFFHPAGNFHPPRFLCGILSWISPYTNLPPPQGSAAAVSPKQLQHLLAQKSVKPQLFMQKPRISVELMLPQNETQTCLCA